MVDGVRMCDCNLKIIGVKITLFVVIAFGGKAPRQDWSGWIQIKTVAFINFLLIRQENSFSTLHYTHGIIER